MSYNETNNCKISSAFLMIFLAVALCDVVNAFTTTTLSYMPKRSTSLSMKRGRGSLKREINDSSSSSSSSGGGGAINWLNTNESVKELPSKDGEVTLIETGAFLVVNKQTNPKGAVSAMKYGGQIYCFEANCPQCKIPMAKAKGLPPNDETKNKVPRVACDFCKSTYNLKTGEILKAEETSGFFGGIAKSVLGAQESAPLTTYQLGEKNGKIMFTMDGM